MQVSQLAAGIDQLTACRDAGALEVFGKGGTCIFFEDPAEIGGVIVAKLCQFRSGQIFSVVCADVFQNRLECVFRLNQRFTHFPEDHGQQEVDARPGGQIKAGFPVLQFLFQKLEHVFKAVFFFR